MAEEECFFADSQTYELGMGRLSRVAGETFLDWLSLPSELRCLDVGCGTGSFTELLLNRTAPSAISAIDPSAGQITFAKRKPWAGRVDFQAVDEAMRSINYDGYIVLETPVGDDPAADNARNLDFIRKLGV